MMGGKEGGRSKETCQREGGGGWVWGATGAADVNARPVPRNTVTGGRERRTNEREERESKAVEKGKRVCLHGRNEECWSPSLSSFG